MFFFLFIFFYFNMLSFSTQTYSKTTSMVPYKHMEHMKETIRALNVLYVYDRSYEPYLVQWLFPMQLAFRDKQAMSDDMGELNSDLCCVISGHRQNISFTWVFYTRMDFLSPTCLISVLHYSEYGR